MKVSLIILPFGLILFSIMLLCLFEIFTSKTKQKQVHENSDLVAILKTNLLNILPSDNLQ